MPWFSSLTNAPHSSKQPPRSSSANTLTFQRLNDLLPVKSSILDENLARVPSPDHHARQMNASNIALQRVGIERRLPRLRIKLYPQRLNKRKIRMIPRQREPLLGGQMLLPSSI